MDDYILLKKNSKPETGWDKKTLPKEGALLLVAVRLTDTEFSLYLAEFSKGWCDDTDYFYAGWFGSEVTDTYEPEDVLWWAYVPMEKDQIVGKTFLFEKEKDS